MNRISERNRKGEANVTEEYQNRLIEKHEEWLLNGDLNVPLMEVAIPYDANAENEQRTIRQIEQFIIGLNPNNINSQNELNSNNARIVDRQSRAHKL